MAFFKRSPSPATPEHRWKSLTPTEKVSYVAGFIDASEANANSLASLAMSINRMADDSKHSINSDSVPVFLQATAESSEFSFHTVAEWTTLLEDMYDAHSELEIADALIQVREHAHAKLGSEMKSSLWQFRNEKIGMNNA